MPTEKLNLGVNSLTDDVVYALPARLCTLFVSGSPTIEQDSLVAFSSAVAVTLSGGQATVAGPFIRCTSGNITLTLKAA